VGCLYSGTSVAGLEHCHTYNNAPVYDGSAYPQASALTRFTRCPAPLCRPPFSPFTSAYKALMDAPPSQRCELISFHSISKGTSGECGLRGGYHVYTNIHPDTVAQVGGWD
jgi:aspartate/methionine/tyrosine aminotransferase